MNINNAINAALFPNPFSDNIHLLISAEQSLEYYVTITDVTGKAIYGAYHMTNDNIIFV